MNDGNVRARVRGLIVMLTLAVTSAMVVLAAISATAAAAASTAGPGHAASNTVPRSATPASHTIAGAEELSLGDEQSGGGGAVDFWLIKLTGGDRVLFSVQEPAGSYAFNLYAPGTTDVQFPTATPVEIAATDQQASDDITLQAPYSGTFILAVCENSADSDCSNTATGSGTNPMNPYTFTPELDGNPCGTRPAGEARAGATIAGSALFAVGKCQAGGGNHIDFWRVKLAGGDRVLFSVQEPAAVGSYAFNLYAPGTTDVQFPTATPVEIAATDQQASDDITLQAPYSGTFILAVCENSADSDCSNTATGSGTNPMNPYTFTPNLVGGPGTTTSLKLSASRLRYGDEKVLKFSVTVRAQFSKSHPTGTVTVKVGQKRICRIKLSAGKGTCSPSSQVLLSAGTYHVVAAYGGSRSFSASVSKSLTLTVTKATKKARG